MALDATHADAAATSYVNTLASQLSLTPTQKTAALTNAKILFEQIYASLKTDIVITILAESIETAGSAAAQAGPPAPIPLSPA